MIIMFRWKECNQSSILAVDHNVFVRLHLLIERGKVSDVDLLLKLLPKGFLSRMKESQNLDHTHLKAKQSYTELERKWLPLVDEVCLTPTAPAMSFLNWSFLFFSPTFCAAGLMVFWSNCSSRSGWTLGIWFMMPRSSGYWGRCGQRKDRLVEIMLLSLIPKYHALDTWLGTVPYLTQIYKNK